MNKEIYKEAYKELLERLKKCGNLTMVQRFDEISGEPHYIRSFHLIEIIEDYMCEILENAENTRIKGGKGRMNKNLLNHLQNLNESRREKPKFTGVRLKSINRNNKVRLIR